MTMKGIPHYASDILTAGEAAPPKPAGFGKPPGAPPMKPPRPMVQKPSLADTFAATKGGKGK